MQLVPCAWHTTLVFSTMIVYRMRVKRGSSHFAIRASSKPTGCTVHEVVFHIAVLDTQRHLLEGSNGTKAHFLRKIRSGYACGNELCLLLAAIIDLRKYARLKNVIVPITVTVSQTNDYSSISLKKKLKQQHVY